MWFIKGKKGRPASGYLEDRLRYIRKTLIHDNTEIKEATPKDKQPKPLQENQGTHCQYVVQAVQR